MNSQTSAGGASFGGSHRRRRRRPLVLAAALVGVLLLAGLLGGALLGLLPLETRDAAGPAPVTTAVTPQESPPAVQPPAAIAADMSQQAFPRGGAPNVLLARDTPSADALASSGLQGQLSAPLLLTASDVLAPETVAELQRLGDPQIHMLGGTAAISAEVEQQLVEAGYGVHRHAGLTAPHTAVDIATRHFASSQAAVLVSMGGAGSDPSEAVANALPASSLAAAEALPVLLTAPDQLTPVTAQHLANSGIQQVLVVGDPTVISEQVVAAIQGLGLEVVRIASGDRFSNAVAVAQHRGFTNAADASVVVLAQGEVQGAWPASFIGSINTGRFVGAPMVLAQGATLPAPTRQFLTVEQPATTFVLCTPGVPESACAEARALLGQSS